MASSSSSSRDSFSLIASMVLDLFNRKISEQYVKRAQANIKLNRFIEAVADANKAIELYLANVKAYFIKGKACIKLKQYHTAKATLEVGAAFSLGGFTDLIKKCDELIAAEDFATEDAQPDNDLLERLPIEHEFYQKPDEVVVTIFAKDIPRDNVTVDFRKQMLGVRINVSDKDTYIFQTCLFAKIIPHKSWYQVMSTKIEIHLAKAEPIQWKYLESNRVITFPDQSGSCFRLSRFVGSGERPNLEVQVKEEEKEEIENLDEDIRRAISESLCLGGSQTSISSAMASSSQAFRLNEVMLEGFVGLITKNISELYVRRAVVNIMLNKLIEAFADANKAIELNPANVKAYFYKGFVCIKLEEYHTAKAALEMGASLAPRFTNLIKKCEEFIAAEDAQPENDRPEPLTIEHEFYQKPDEVVVTMFAKDIPRDSITVDFGEKIISVKINVSDKDEYLFQPHLFGKIIPPKCWYEVMSTKIEIHLAKAEPIQWTYLESDRVITRSLPFACDHISQYLRKRRRKNKKI